MNFSSHSGFEWLRTLYYGIWWKWSSDHYELYNSRVIGLNHSLPFYVTLDRLHTSSLLGLYIFLSTCFQIVVIFVGLKVLTGVAMKSSVFCGIMLVARLACWLAYSTNLKMKAICSSKRQLIFTRLYGVITQRQNSSVMIHILCPQKRRQT
jgi:hypothetical protein